MADEPTPPDTIPNYVQDGVERQSPETLREVAHWATELADWKDREVNVEEIQEDLPDDEELDDVVDDESSGTIVTKKIPCGKDCGGCPHGPYQYRVKRNGESLDWEYLGKAD